MNSAEHYDDLTEHSHGDGAQLESAARQTLHRGLEELLGLTEGMEFRPLPIEEYPFPLTQAVYKRVPNPDAIRSEITQRMHDDPVSVLENALGLLELYESNQDDIGEFLDDGLGFLGTVFRSKRRNGWACTIGQSDRKELEQAINARWKFEFFNGPPRDTGVYVLLNMLTRYSYVYGKMPFGDPHGLSHFVEEHAPGLIICRGHMSDLELTLSLAAMKIGVPAIVPENYPFPLGRMVRCDRLEDIVESVVSFANIRKLLKMPDDPGLPDYCDEENQEEKVSPDVTWGDTPESFYIVRKGEITSPGFTVTGEPKGPMGVQVTIDAEPMDAFDTNYIERRIIQNLSMMRGVAVQYTGEKFALHQTSDTNLDPQRIGEVLLASIRKSFPRIEKVQVEVIFDCCRLGEMEPEIRKAKEARKQQIESTTEESIEKFYGCVGCSPFAPDHICILTPDRPPQCGRNFAQVKAGALYAYDDTSNIHHSAMHKKINSFIVVDKGKCLDPIRGEWEGVNATAGKITHGRTSRIQLHAIDEAPHTSCSCFRIIMFQTDTPKEGIGIMDRAFEGRAPDGRSWKDLHYALTGKQVPGLAGTSPNYLKSAKFLQAHGGWQSVVWITPKLAAIMGDKLPEHVDVGE